MFVTANKPNKPIKMDISEADKRKYFHLVELIKTSHKNINMFFIKK